MSNRTNSQSDFYEKVICPLQDQMIRTISRIVRDIDRAEDVLQDAMTKVWSNRERMDAHPNPSAYVLSICISTGLDALRRMERTKASERMLSSETNSLPGPMEPGSQVIAREVADEVMSAISDLSPQQAKAVLLRLIHEQTYAEIALVMDCSEATVRTHVARGRDALTRSLSHLAPHRQVEESL